MALTTRLFGLLALLMMPPSMSIAPTHAHPVAKIASIDHRAEQSRIGQTLAPQSTDCATMCTYLPASAKQLEAPVIAPPQRLIALAEAIVGIIPEVTTPPPKSGDNRTI